MDQTSADSAIRILSGITVRCLSVKMKFKSGNKTLPTENPQQTPHSKSGQNADNTVRRRLVWSTLKIGYGHFQSLILIKTIMWDLISVKSSNSQNQIIWFGDCLKLESQEVSSLLMGYQFVYTNSTMDFYLIRGFFYGNHHSEIYTFGYSDCTIIINTSG